MNEEGDQIDRRGWSLVREKDVDQIERCSQRRRRAGKRGGEREDEYEEKEKKRKESREGDRLFIRSP